MRLSLEELKGFPGERSMSIYVNPDTQEFYTALISGIVSFLIIPVQIIVLTTLLTQPELRRNASYLILARLIACEILQSVGLVFNAIFIMFVGTITVIAPMRWYCRFVLSCIFPACIVLMCELSVFRILVVAKKYSPQKLPTPMLVVELICWFFILVLIICVCATFAMPFDGFYWVYSDGNVFGAILNYTEVFFCIPVILITYFSYLVLMYFIYGNRKGHSLESHRKQEWTMFVQNTFTTVYYITLIFIWHVIDPVVRNQHNVILDIFTLTFWPTTFYWTSLLLLLFNKTVRSKVFKGRLSRVGFFSSS